MHRFPPRTSLDFTLRRCWLISLLRRLYPSVISERFLVLHPQYHSVWDRLSWEEQDVLERHIPSLWLSDYLNNGPQGLGISCWVKKAPAASQRKLAFSKDFIRFCHHQIPWRRENDRVWMSTLTGNVLHTPYPLLKRKPMSRL